MLVRATLIGLCVLLLSSGGPAALAQVYDESPMVLTEPPAPVSWNTFSIAAAHDDGQILISSIGDFATIPGVVFLFDAATGEYADVTYLNPGAVDNAFGQKVAFVGDSALAVAAPEESTAARADGKVYLFNRSDGSLTTCVLVSPDPGEGHLFGSSLAPLGTQLLVGEEGAAPGGLSSAGLVHLFDADPDGTCGGPPVRTFQKQAPQAGDLFGDSIAVVGGNVLVGASRDSTDVSEGGRAYLFDPGTGERVAVFVNPSPSASDRFGSSVAAVGLKVLIGSPLDVDEASPTGERPGKAYLFDAEQGSDYGLLLAIRNPTPAHLDRFGQAVAAAGDELLVGAFRDDETAPNAGAAYLFDGDTADADGTADLLRTFENPAPASGDWFGRTLVSVGGDLLIGAEFDDPQGVVDAGAAFLYRLDSDEDGVADRFDNCPAFPNPLQANADGDDFGDLCDICPADPADECDPGGSAAATIDPTGGTVESGDGGVAVSVPGGALNESTTISVTQTVFNDPEADLALSTGPGLGLRLAVYDLEPEGVEFNEPVTITVVADVSTLNDTQKANLGLYVENDAGDLELVPSSSCTIVGDEATCTAEVTHFSVYALVAPLDSDGDGIFDEFGGIVDVCPGEPNVVDGFLSPMTELVPDGEDVPLPDKAFKSNRTIPMKLDYFCGTTAVTDADDVTPPTLLEVWRIGDAEPLPIIDPDSGEETDTGVLFRWSGEHWIYNYGTKGLAGGEYEVAVQLPDGRVFRGGFVLR